MAFGVRLRPRQSPLFSSPTTTMLRALAPRIPVTAQRRSFVSTVLLTRDWESATVNTLKTELRKRGLLQ